MSRRVKLTNTDKLMFPEAKLTKGDILAYYEQIAPVLLPHLKDRPITVERLPNGLGGPRFWQKNTPNHYPDWIPRIDIPTAEGKSVRYALVNNLDTLLYFVNQGTITFHVYMSRVKKLERPDYVLFDLDPGASKFSDVVKIAKAIHVVLEELKMDGSAKTSGKTGIHVTVPWKQKGGYDAARQWALQIAEHVTQRLPKIATTERYIRQRRGRVYIDVIQNALGHHAVPPYVIRATPLATVSTPLDWDELTARLNPKKFDTQAVLKRVARRGAEATRSR